jgi:hypothetical protein
VAVLVFVSFCFLTLGPFCMSFVFQYLAGEGAAVQPAGYGCKVHLYAGPGGAGDVGGCEFEVEGFFVGGQRGQPPS